MKSQEGMMNIFIMVLVFLFMAGYYFMDSPSQRVMETELDYAISQTDLRSIAECAVSAHAAAIKDIGFDDKCVQDYEIASSFVCMNEKHSIVECDLGKKLAFSFITTSTAALNENSYNDMLEILEKHYPDANDFGIFLDNSVLSGNGKHPVAKSIAKEAELSNGQLVYITQYEIPDIETDFIAPAAANINCPDSTVKTYRFGRWQCLARNEKKSCTGDRIWDSDLQECVPDNSRKPLCAAQQTAVMLDDLWECVDPFLEKQCSGGMVARLNYTSLEWECVEDPEKTKTAKKCSPPLGSAIYGALGSMLRTPPSYCTDCEEMLTDPETCATTCVPA
ncbi:MAG: hypothetical protein LBD50_02830, partial [Rickettsiales bacterium]|nr:hypothetical protein [Rickettsiales bacterium]